jgi:hypothetical protein
MRDNTPKTMWARGEADDTDKQHAVHTTGLMVLTMASLQLRYLCNARRLLAQLPPFVRVAAYRAFQGAEPEPTMLPLIAGKLLLPIAPLAQAAQSRCTVQPSSRDGVP